MGSSVSNLLSSNNTGTGLGQGIDVSQFVTLALAGDQANITQLQKQQTALSSQTTALAQITTDLNNLQQASFALSDPLGALNGLTTTSSNSGVVTATAASSAQAGTHNVTVSALATTSSYYSNSLPASSVLAAGSFSVQIGTAPAATITIDSTNNTLAGLAEAINTKGIGVQASVISDANGSRLALVSATTGLPGDLTVSSNTTGLTFTKAVTGSNASLVVDGVPISSTSNTVSGAINGVTLNLASALPGTSVAITTAPDTTQATAAVNSFVSAYNTAIKDINAQFSVLSDGSGGGPLEADGSLREAQAALLAAVSYSTAGNNGAVNLESIGVSLNNDGTLTANAATLTSALASNFSGVQAFLQATTTGFANNLSNVLTNVTDSSTGTLGLDATGISQSSQALSQQISDLQAALAVKQAALTQTYAQVNVTLQELPLLQQQLSQQLASA
jgi:flagellar hook-associated protein 2